MRLRAADLLNAGNAEDRKRIIADITRDIKAHATGDILPTARSNGQRAAGDIIGKTPNPQNPGEEIKRGLATAELDRRQRERAEIVVEQIDTAGQRLAARLTKFWREPGESREGKRERLQELFSVQEKRRREYDTRLADFYAGKTKQRPGRPQLDFISEFVADVKAETRSQARRIGTDAELMTFRRNGYDQFIWITPNGHLACPDCQKRQGAVLTLERWEALGRPGSGMTVCGDNCFCTLLPVETMKVSPSLAKRGDDFGRADGPMTTAAQAEIFNRNRL